MKKNILLIFTLLIFSVYNFAQEKSSDQDNPTKDIEQNDDVIIFGSLNVGDGAIADRNFGSDTQIFSENNLRILFEDTSNIDSFPSNDWRIVVNGDQNGDPNYFAIQDATAGTVPFKIEKAPGNALVVDAQGDVGIGTGSPVLDLHVADDDSPTLRLEQNGSSGFTPQTWDVAGNEANFFVRDVSNGSTLPFRIEPGAKSNMLYIDSDDELGIGTSTPDMFLDVYKSDEGTTAEKVAVFQVSDDATGELTIENNTDTDGEFQGLVKGVNDKGNSGLTLLAIIDDNIGSAAAMVINATDLAGDALDNHAILDIQNDGVSQFAVDFNGFIGIGTDTPTERLHVVGNIAKTGSLVGASDARIKKDIKSISNAMQIISQLDGKSYLFNSEKYPNMNLPEGMQYGLIAQEVEQVMQDIVVSDLMNAKDSNGRSMSIKGVEYEQLIAILVNALKEQNTTIENLKANLNANNDRIAALEAAILKTDSPSSNTGEE
jgi:hypothetical protein